VVEQR